MGQYDADKERFQESSDQFQQAMLSAIRAQQRCVQAYLTTLGRVEQREGELHESIEELKRLIMQQGDEIRDLRTDTNTPPNDVTGDTDR